MSSSIHWRLKIGITQSSNNQIEYKYYKNEYQFNVKLFCADISQDQIAVDQMVKHIT